MPLQRRLPKFGFRNPNRVEYAPSQPLCRAWLKGRDRGKCSRVGCWFLYTKMPKSSYLVWENLPPGKDLVHAASESATEAVEKAGGELVIL